MYKTTAACLLMLAAAHAYATMPGQDADWEQALVIPCPPLMTDQECRDHKAALAQFKTESDRNAYLTDLTTVMRDRAKSCECAMLNIKH